MQYRVFISIHYGVVHTNNLGIFVRDTLNNTQNLETIHEM